MSSMIINESCWVGACVVVTSHSGINVANCGGMDGGILMGFFFVEAVFY